MTKTKKTVLAAFAFTLALVGGGVGLAACDSSDGDSTHAHVWSNWTVEADNAPTSQSGGKATRDCSGEGTCDAKDLDKEYALPALGDSSYIISDDTAQVGVAGTGKYTYNKNGIKVEFTAATPAKAHVHEGGEWTVADENMPTADAKGKATRVCSASDDFCDWTVADLEIELPALSDSSYTVTDDTAKVGVAGTGKYSYEKGGVKVVFTAATPAKPHVHEGGVWTVSDENQPTATAKGKATRVCTAEDDFCDWTAADLEYELPELNEEDYLLDYTKNATCTYNGEIDYTYEINGVSVTFTVETPTDPDVHVLTEHEGTMATCGLPGNLIYYTCECGKLFKDANAAEEFADLDETVVSALGHKTVEVVANSTVKPNTKALKRPNDADATATGIAHYKCSVCKKTFKDAKGENEITSTYVLARAGMLWDLGNNLVDATDVANAKAGTNYAGFYIADNDGVYTFTFGNGVTVAQIACVLTGTTSNNVAYNTTGWQTGNDSYKKFVVADPSQPLSGTVTVSMTKGEWIIFTLSSIKYSVNVEAQPILIYGNTKINITETYEFKDVYEFTPTETKTYSMTVPAGVEVLIDNKDFIVGADRVANFEGVAGETIMFTFKNTKTGPVEINIGEEVETPKLTPDEPYNGFTINSFKASVLEIGDIEEGTYKVTITFSQSLGRAQCYFGKNISEDITDYYDTSGSTKNDSPAWVNFQFPDATILNNADCTASRTNLTCYVTLNLKKGDKLVFLVSNISGSADISMEKVAD